MSRYCDLVAMMKPRGVSRGCPHDGLGCPYKACSIASDDTETVRRAWVADIYGPDFHCVKREHAKIKPETT